MINAEDCKRAFIINIKKRTTGTVSAATAAEGAVIDTKGFDFMELTPIKGQGSGAGKGIFLFSEHDTASAMTYASGTAISAWTTSGTASTATSWPAIRVNLAAGGRKRFFACKLSTATASAILGCEVRLSRSKQVPPSSTGFSSVTSSPSAS